MATALKERRNPLTLRTGPVAPLALERPGPAKLPYGQIRTDGGTQMRAGINEATAEEYAEELRQGAVFPPVTVFYDGQAYWLGDGFHRVRAYVLAYGERVEIPCEVRPGTRRDAVLCAAGANAVHGLRRTNADKRRAVETLLRDEEWGRWSDREIARRCHVSDRFVNGVRKALSDVLTANDSQSERTYVTRHGTQATMRVTGQQVAAQQRQAVSHAPSLPLDDSPSDALSANRSQSVPDTLTANDSQSARTDVTRIERVPGGTVTRAGRKPVPGSSPDAGRAAELLALYRAVLSTLGEYGALTGKHTHTPAVRRALEPLIEELKQHKAQ